MKDLSKIQITVNASIKEAIELINETANKIALVVSSNGRLLGTITDGDFRRSILAGISIDDSVEKIMNPEPTVGNRVDTRQTILLKMKEKGLHHIPIIDDAGCPVRLEIFDEFLAL